jgi:sialate O-acetylesterase
MSNLRMTRLISDGMVLQRDRKVRIWGYYAPGRDIEISFLDDVYKTISDSDGYFEVWLNPHHYGGPYKMEISDDA